jgi:hypothetical protein
MADPHTASPTSAPLIALLTLGIVGHAPPPGISLMRSAMWAAQAEIAMPP